MMETEPIERLLRQAHLFDDPSAYAAGIRDAVEALRAANDLAAGEQRTHAVRSA